MMGNMRKILHICVNGPVSDGWTYQENLLTKYHAKIGYEVTLIAPMWCWNDKGELIKTTKRDYIDENNVHVIRLEIKGKDDFGRKFKHYERLEETIEKINPDIVFIHSCAFADIPLIVKYLKNHPECQAFADNHADFSNSATTWVSKNILYKLIWRHYAQKLVPVVRKFYGVLPARVDFLTEIYKLPKDKCEYLPMGADDEFVEEAEAKNVVDKTRKQFGVLPSDFLIVTGGKIDPWKKQTILLMKAVHELNKSDLKLIVFGSVDKSIYDQVIAIADNLQVIYAGWKNTEESYRLFAAANLVVFPGRHSVFWEQVAGQGKPMVVKDWPGTHHVDLGGNALFLKEDSVDEIKNTIEELYKNPDKLKSMTDVATDKGKKFFSYRDIAYRCVQEQDGGWK